MTASACFSLRNVARLSETSTTFGSHHRVAAFCQICRLMVTLHSTPEFQGQGATFCRSERAGINIPQNSRTLALCGTLPECLSSQICRCAMHLLIVKSTKD